MKKALLLLLFLIQTNLLLAQTMPGIRLGGSISKINGISTSFGSYNWIRHYHGGIILAHKINDNLYLQPELNYAQKGYQYEIARSNKQVYKDTVLYQETNRINYLDLPILAKIGTKGFYFELGPQFSFLADGERTVTRTTDAGGAINKHSHTRNLIGVVERFDIGFVGGFGYQTLSGLGLGVRFNQSFKEVIDQENWKRNVVVQLSAFYLFGKQKELKSIQQPPAVPNPDIDYYKKRRASKKGYTITTRMNMGRVTFTKLENSNRNHGECNLNCVISCFNLLALSLSW
ncbi:porin family protein, partial [Pontibacter sp. H249]|uniref:porin family protein n=1 Tax=Pontibacter sp. H249 TaxID=3133420 RepID=UPI0030BC219C